MLVGLAAACLAAAAAAASADAGLAASAGLARMGGAGLVAGPANATEPTPSAWSWHALFPQVRGQPLPGLMRSGRGVHAGDAAGGGVRAAAHRHPTPPALLG